MGLFDFFKKNSKTELSEQPLAYWEESSYMVLIPRDERDCGFDEGILDRIGGIEGVRVTEFSMPHETAAGQLRLTYEGEEYEVGFFWSKFSLPAMMQHQNQYFTEDEMEAMKKASAALTLFMKFGPEPKVSYQLQLKIAERLMPDLVGIMDESAEKMLCARWVRQAARSSVLPSANSLFIVQAVTGKNEVWLHTHGLARCGLTELEILQSDRENYDNHYYVISTLASTLLDGNDKDSMAYIARMTNGRPLVVKYLPWTEGLKQYKKTELGGAEDRREAHNTKTSLIFAYKNEHDAENGILTKIPELSSEIGDNPIFLISTEETQRMSMLAREKFECLKTAFGDKDNHIIVKIGLPTASGSSPEHIWFELLDFEGDAFNAELTQEPYDVPDMHEGDRGTYTVDDVTDWIVYTPNGRITPETAYLLM